jgi:hypothetical protein
MKNLLGALCLAAFACALPACTSKGSTLVPLTAQQHAPPIQQNAGDNGGGPSQNCPESGCPDPTPTP